MVIPSSPTKGLLLLPRIRSAHLGINWETSNLVPRAHDPFGLRQGLRALGRALANRIFQSANRGLPVTLRRSRSRNKMAEKSVLCHQAGPIFLSDRLEVIGKEDVTLKEKQEQILRIIALDKNDVLAVLPTIPWSIK